MKSKRETEILSWLNSGKTEYVIKALQVINDKNYSGLISHIADLYQKSKSDTVRDLLVEFFNNLKDQNFAPSVVDVIKKSKSASFKKIILSSCWQSGIDYSDYLSFFTNLVIKEDYSLAIEAFSVIEDSMLREIQAKVLQENIFTLKCSLDMKHKERSYLYVELIKVLEEKLKKDTLLSSSKN